jgi:AcrR family transcriptional regulator
VTGIDRERRLGPRAARAQETRRRIIDAALRLFVTDGYAPTTMSAIAQEAGVAVQTLYLSFGSKANILAAALDFSIVGDDEPVALIDRPWFQDVCAENDGHRAIARFCNEVAHVFRRVTPLHVAMRAATGDAEVASLFATDQQNRYNVQREVVAILAGKSGFDVTSGEDRATDIVYALLSEAVYVQLCGDRGWTLEDWTAWIIATLSNQLFPTTPSSPGAESHTVAAVTRT